MPKDGEEPIYGGERGDGTLVPPEMIAGTFVGNGCLLTPDCLRARHASRLPEIGALALGSARGLPGRAPRLANRAGGLAGVLRGHLRAEVLRGLPHSFPVPVHDELLRQVLLRLRK